MINKLILGLMVAVLMSCVPFRSAFAQSTPTQQEISAWGNMSEKEKQEYRLLYQENKNSPRWQEYVKRYRWLKSLPAEEQHNIRNNWELFKSLSPAESKKFLENLKAMKHMSPVQREQFREKLKFWYSLSPHQREVLRLKFKAKNETHKDEAVHNK